MQRFPWVGVARVIPPDVRYGILPALTPRKLATASCLSLACEAGGIARAPPPPDPYKPRARARGLPPHTSPGREPGDCGNKGHPA